jgi:hypothetical protein
LKGRYAPVLNTLTDLVVCARPLPTEFIEKLKNLGDGIVIDEIVEDE